MDNENNNQYYTPQQDFQQSYQMPQGNGNMPVTEQKANVGLAILSYIIPIVGIVLYFTKKNDQKKAAKVYGKCALACIIINVIVVIIASVIGGIAGARVADEVAENPEAYQEYLENYNFDNYDIGDITEPQAE